MRIYTEEVHCDICGGLGMARLETAAGRWLGVKVRHTNPEVCSNNLKSKADELAKREAALTHAHNL